jgi:hypothetical protein
MVGTYKNWAGKDQCLSCPDLNMLTVCVCACCVNFVLHTDLQVVAVKSSHFEGYQFNVHPHVWTLRPVLLTGTLRGTKRQLCLSASVDR